MTSCQTRSLSPPFSGKRRLISCLDYYQCSHLVLFGGPESHGGDGVVGDLQTGGVTVASTLIRVELTEDVLHTELHGALAEVAGRLPSPQVGPVQVERVETLAVSQHRVKQTEPLALLNKLGQSEQEHGLCVKLRKLPQRCRASQYPWCRLCSWCQSKH